MMPRFVPLIACALAACDGTSRSPDVLPPGDGDGGVSWPDAALPVDAAPAADLAPDLREEEVGTFELPRVPADPALTRRLVGGPAALVGGDAGCSADPRATSDRWCAFSRNAGATTELWVIDVTRAAAGTPIPCDGSSPSCLRLTSNLWTGEPLWGASHPTAHRFEGDTLLFHADGGMGPGNVYQGLIWVWRPGWTAARALTGPHALLCAGERRTTAVMCFDEALVEATGTGFFDRPILRELDLTAAVVVESTARLPVVTRVRNASGDNAWRARFSQDGATLAFSNVATPGATEALRVIRTADAGKVPPAMVLPDVADWEIAHDGSKLYYLTGYDRARGEAASGTLTLADYPSGANPAVLLNSVRSFELLGAGGEVFSDVDRGLYLTYAGSGTLAGQALMPSRANPTDLIVLGTRAQGVQVASDVRHTLYFQDVHGAEFPVAYVSRNDRSGLCQLTSDVHAETYGAAFTASARTAVWIEYFRNQSDSEEGWSARPEDCGEKIKWGDYVAWYVLDGDDFVIFEGGDAADSTSWLQVTPLSRSPRDPWPSPTVINEHPEPGLGIVHTAGASWILYSVSRGDPAARGVYMHGPLRRRAP
jgi:hypothetical protein